MMEIARFRDGVMDYATNHMMPKMDSKGQFVLGMALGMVSSRIESLIGQLADNEMVKALGIIHDGQIDYDTMFSAAMAQMKRQGKLVWDVPLLGRMAFDEQDLRDLHQCIMKQGGAAV
jgi:hypothetical protein